MTKRFKNRLNRRIVNPFRRGLSNGVKYSLSALLLSIALVYMSTAATCPAQAATSGNWWQTAQEGGLDRVGQAYGGGEPQDVRMTVADIIRIVLGFLGIIAVILVIYAGFKWMTAGGNEENVATAKKILIAGVIGLVIIIASYAIADFVISRIYGAAVGQTTS